MNALCSVVLKEKQACDGLTRSEAIDLIDMLDGDEFLPIEIEAKEHESSAMGFITVAFSDEMDFNHDGLSEFVASILDDMDKESEDCRYEFCGHQIWLTR